MIQLPSGIGKARFGHAQARRPTGQSVYQQRLGKAGPWEKAKIDDRVPLSVAWRGFCA